MTETSFRNLVRNIAQHAIKDRYAITTYAAVGVPLFLYLLRRSKSFLSTSESLEDDDPVAGNEWTVVRCASKDRATRVRTGGDRSIMIKEKCFKLKVFEHGVLGLARGWWGVREVPDYNDYRTQGHKGRFEPGTNNRAVSIMVTSVYAELQTLLPGAKICIGDLGENLTLQGPAHYTANLQVGMKLRIGDEVEIEIAEPNHPCFRFEYVPWSSEATRLFGQKWRKSEDLPMLGRKQTGGRGWLCRVLKEGSVQPGDRVRVLSYPSPSVAAEAGA